MSLMPLRQAISNGFERHVGKAIVAGSLAGLEYIKMKGGYRQPSKAVPYASKSRIVRSKTKKRKRTVKGRRSKKSNRGGYSRVTPRSTRKAFVSGKDVKLRKNQRGKIHVSSVFKKMVKKAMEEEQSEGTFTDYASGYIPCLGVDNQQGSTPFLTVGDGSLGYGNQNLELFSPLRLLDAASVLFNQKVRINNYTGVLLNFQFDQLKLDVDYTSAVFTVRNNTQCNRHISFYECIPKSHSATNAYNDWINFLAQEATDGINLGTVSQQTTVNSIGATPGITKKFATKWKSSVREILLGPGQMTEFVVMGPKNFTYDYSKFYINTATTEWPRGIGKSCFFISRPVEPTPMTTGTGPSSVVGYNNQIANPTSGQYPYGIAVVVRYVYKMMAPELTPVANRKTYVYSYYNYLQTILNGNTSRIDEENPVVTETLAGTHGTGTGPVTGV